MALSDKIAFISAIIAVVAAILTFWGIIISKKGLSRAIAEQERRNPNVHLYLVDSFRVRSPRHERYIYAFCVTISNLSDAQNSVSRLELEAYCHEQNGPKVTHVFSHNSEVAKLLPQKSLNLLPSPCGLEAKGCITGWALFEIPAFLLNAYVIDRFRVVVHTVAAKEPSYVDSYLVSELYDEKIAKN